MATPDVIAFWSRTGAMERQKKMDALAYDAKRFQRRTHPTYKGMVKDSTGSWATLVANQDQSQKPFNTIPLKTGGASCGMRGGIRDNRNYAKVKSLLQQRADDMNEQDNPDIPRDLAIPALTEEDKLKIELNSLLQQLDDLVEIGDYAPINTEVFRRITSLLVRLSPDLRQEDLQDMNAYWDNIVENMEGKIAQKGWRGIDLDANEGMPLDMVAQRATQSETLLQNRLEMIMAIRKYIQKMSELTTEDRRERILASRAFMKEVGLKDGTVKKAVAEAIARQDALLPPPTDTTTVTGTETTDTSGTSGDSGEALAEEEAPAEEEEEGADEEAGAEEEAEAEEEAPAPAPKPTKRMYLKERIPGLSQEEWLASGNYALLNARLVNLYNASPTGVGNLSPELQRIWRVLHPRSAFPSRVAVFNQASDFIKRNRRFP